MHRKKTNILAAVLPLTVVVCVSMTIVGGIVMWIAASEGTGPGELLAGLSTGRQSARPVLAQVTLTPRPSPTPYPSSTPTSTATIAPQEPIATPTWIPLSTEPTVINDPPPPSPTVPIPSPTQTPLPRIETAIESPVRPGSPFPERPATRLVIPAMDMDVPVILSPIENRTWKVDHLGTDFAGHLEGTASPGSSSNVVLAAHVTVAHNVYGPFAGLAQLQPGDSIIVYVDDQPFTYITDYRRLVERTDVDIAYPTETGRVTLITCSNWSDELRAYQQRLVVVGHLAQRE